MRYLLRWSGGDSDLMRDLYWYAFEVVWDDRRAGVSVGIGRSFIEDSKLVDHPDRESIEARIALREIRSYLTATDLPEGRRIVVDSSDRTVPADGWTFRKIAPRVPYERKECKHRAGKQGEYYCSAAEEGDEWGGRTTLANCEACGLPSTDIACSNLVHPSTRSLRCMGQPPTRQLWDVQCELGRTVSEASAAECVPGGRDCWVQTYEPEEAGVGLAAGGAEFSIAEAIDQVNAAFRTRYRQRLIVIEEARSIQDLAGECPTDDSLQHKLQVLAGLMENMPLAELLTQQEAEGSQGTIDLLQRLAARDFPTLPQQYVHNLRQINRLAAGYPRHAKVKNMERAHAELGLPYPLSDYPKAWAIVRETFIQTLRQIVLHLG